MCLSTPTARPRGRPARQAQTALVCTVTALPLTVTVVPAAANSTHPVVPSSLSRRTVARAPVAS
jgi:hypothetical protein